MAFKKKQKNTSNLSLRIVASLSKKQYNRLIYGEYYMELPAGVKMYNKSGSRCLTFDCDNTELSEMLCEALDESGIAWSESY